MIWKILRNRKVTVSLPVNFNKGTMYQFIEKAIDEQCDAKCSTIYFNFSKLGFIEPLGIVVLSNLIQYFHKLGVKVWFSGHTRNADALRFMDDAQFFSQYLKKPIFPDGGVRSGTIPLHLVESQHTAEFLGYKLMPWVAGQVGLTNSSLESVKSCLEEIFHNITDHSGVNIGCACAQHYPRSGEIQIAISDFGMGIPKVVATKVANLSDQQAIFTACQEGFSTQSNVRNRGAGLPNLMRYVTQRNQGTVLIASGKGELSAVRGEAGTTKVTPRGAGFYPGTLVRVILKTGTLEKNAAADTELQPFEWI